MPIASMSSAAFGYGRLQRPAVSSGDKIADSLTTSLSAYNSASAGSWVKITSTEYTALQTNVTGTNKIGATDTIMSAAASSSFGSQNLQVANAVGTNTPVIPANQYIFAFSMKNTAAVSGIRVLANKNSASPATGYSYVGNVLPTTTTGINYFVLKGSSTTNGATAGVLGMWALSNSCSNLQNISGGTGLGVGYGIYYSWPVNPPTSGTLNLLSGNRAFAIQALTTDTKQWT